ncbi:MAG: GNAT family N-acetyltransferase [Casimicrobiaceae bacterium]
MHTIRAATEADFPAIWSIFRQVIAGGDTYVYGADTTRVQARRLWTAPPAKAFVAELADRVAGTYSLRPNQPALGDHVANCGYITDPQARGQGIATAMCEHSLATARELGFTAMQFNFVVASNASAIRLWEKHGFSIVGRVPGAFRHRTGGLTDALIMHRPL